MCTGPSYYRPFAEDQKCTGFSPGFSSIESQHHYCYWKVCRRHEDAASRGYIDPSTSYLKSNDDPLVYPDESCCVSSNYKDRSCCHPYGPEYSFFDCAPDRSENCAYWAGQGYCASEYRTFMMDACESSCRKCIGVPDAKTTAAKAAIQSSAKNS